MTPQDEEQMVKIHEALLPLSRMARINGKWVRGGRTTSAEWQRMMESAKRKQLVAAIAAVVLLHLLIGIAVWMLR